MTAPEAVIDASVLGAAFFSEAGSPAARRYLRDDRRLIAPDFLFVELASLAAKKVRRGETTPETAARALGAPQEFVSDFHPARPYAAVAYALAAEHGLSAYDGLYLALAKAHGLVVVTLDGKLARRVAKTPLEPLVQLLS